MSLCFSAQSKATMTRGGVMQYQLSAGCGHGRLSSFTLADLASNKKKEKKLRPASNIKRKLAFGLSLQPGTDLLTEGTWIALRRRVAARGGCW